MSVFIIAVISFLVGLIGYNWYLNRELGRKVSWIAAVPGWPLLGNILEFGKTKDTLEITQKLTERHGRLIFLNLVFYSVIISTDYDFTEFILGTQNVLNKSYGYSFLHQWLGTGLLTSEGSKWKTRRRLITPAFHFSILEQFIDSFESNGKILIEKLNKLVKEDAIDVYQLITLYALDVICETAMGVPVNAQIDENSPYVLNVKEICRLVSERWVSKWKRSRLFYRFSRDYYLEKRVVDFLHNYTFSVIDSKIKKLKEDKGKEVPVEVDIGAKKKMAFLDILLQSKVDGEPLSREDIREEVDTFMFEGHDTSSSAISFVLYLLARHQDVQEQVVEEQRHIVGEDRDRKITYQDLQNMKYLECVIKETLRLYPSVPTYARNVNEDVYYQGNLLPKGANVNIFAYGMMRDPKNYPDPLRFDPTRFLEVDGKRPYTYIPFSAGPRNCIGQKFALMEIKSVVSKIIRNFHVFPTVPEHKLELVLEIVLRSISGVQIRIARRNW